MNYDQENYYQDGQQYQINLSTHQQNEYDHQS